MTKNTKKHSARNISEEFRRAAAQRVYNNQKSKAGVARELGIPESTLRGWCNKYKKEIESEREMENPGEPMAKRAKIECPNNKEGGKGELLPNTQHPKQPHVSKSESLLDLSQNFNNGTLKSTSEELARVGKELGLNQPEVFNNNNLVVSFPFLQQIGEIINSEPTTTEQDRLRREVIYYFAMQQQYFNPARDQKPNNNQRTTPNHRSINETPTTSHNSLPKSRHFKPVVASSMNGFATSTPVEAAPLVNGVNALNCGNAAPTPFNNANGNSVAASPVFESATTSRDSHAASPQNQTFWKSYKQVSNEDNADEPVNLVLRNLLLGGNGEEAAPSCAPSEEVIRSGERFLEWMTSPDNSLVTASEAMKMKGILDRAKSAGARRNEVENEGRSGRKSSTPMKILRAV